jgi:hypothetical protein
MQKIGDTFRLSASDLVGHLNCRNLTELDVAVAKGNLAKPKSWADPHPDVLRERGIRHEQAYVDHLREEGRSVSEGPASCVRVLPRLQRGLHGVFEALHGAIAFRQESRAPGRYPKHLDVARGDIRQDHRRGVAPRAVQGRQKAQAGFLADPIIHKTKIESFGLQGFPRVIDIGDACEVKIEFFGHTRKYGNYIGVDIVVLDQQNPQRRARTERRHVEIVHHYLCIA